MHITTYSQYLGICHISKQKRNLTITILFTFILCPILFCIRSYNYQYPTDTSRYYNQIITPKFNSIHRHSSSSQERFGHKLRNRLNPNHNTVSSHLHKPLKTLHLHISPNYPRMVIIGSTKGGTTTLINILNNHLKSFYTLNNNKAPDLHYWTQCLPCDGFDEYNQGMSAKHITSQWDVNTNNLCTHRDNHVKCTPNDYMHTIIHDRHRINISVHIAERTSGYMKFPWIAKLFAVNFPNTILLYSIREKLTQKYSRWNTFKKREHTIDVAFQHVLIIFESLRFQKLLLPLINNSDQSDMIRDKIVFEVLRYPMEDGKLRHVLSDLCPYLNVLVWVKILEMYNGENGFSKFKIIQSEWMFEDIMKSAIYLQCVAEIENHESENEFDKCYEYYMDNMEHKMEILSEESIIELSDNSFLRDDGYEYDGLDLKLFDETQKYMEICDMRLFELIREEKYKSLVVGTDWNYDRWVNKRLNMRGKLLRS